MYAKKLCHLILLFIVFPSLNAQSIALKGYGGIRSEKEYRFYGDMLGAWPREPENNNIQIYTIKSESGFIMPAIVIQQANGNFWELSFSSKGKYDQTQSYYQYDTGGAMNAKGGIQYGQAKGSGFDAQLEYNIMLRKNQENLKWRPFLGALLNVTSSSMTFTPNYGDLFTREKKKKGAGLGFIPRMQYLIGDNLFLDFSATFFVFAVDLEHSANRNPVLTTEQQENDVLESDIFGKYWLRVGIGWKIPLKKKK
ncbi:MAG: hypothetical protein IT262_08920 [Saprospiraceae bacterium]|nr:hypothetical protein [Saprospiraceae bacterium]